MCGFTDPDNRRTYPWGKCDYELIYFYRDIIFVHRSHTALKKGGMKVVNANEMVREVFDVTGFADILDIE